MMNRKQDMCDKLEQIRNLITTDHDANGYNESQLGDLVQSFYSDYMSFDPNHIQKLQKHESSSSSTSGSESNDSDGQEENELEEELREKKSRITLLEDEIFELRSEIDRLEKSNDLQDMMIENEKLQEENSLLERTVVELKLQKSDLERILEEKVPEMLNELEEVSIEATFEIDGVSVQKPEEQVSSLEENLERTVKRQKTRFQRLSSTHKILQEQNRSSRADLDTAKEKIEELEAKEIGLLKKLQQSNTEKKNLDKEISKLHELLESLEVHLRLTNQKFKVTKSEFKQKDELQRKKMKDVQENLKTLESQNKEMFEEMRYMEYKFRKIKEDSEGGATDLTDAFQNFEMLLDETFGDYSTRLKGCYEDVGMLKDKLRTLVCCKKDLEGIVKEKEEECKLKDEEKKEAIKQLCLQIDYHRENCNQLIQRSVSFHGSRR